MNQRLQDTSAVVVSRNTGALLMDCLGSLISEGVEEQKIVVVDPDSRDNTAELMRNRYPRACYLQLVENAGYAAAVNRGAALIEAEYMIISNGDVALRRGCLRFLVDEVEKDPSIAMAGPAVFSPAGDLMTRYSRTGIVRALLLEILPARVRGTWRRFEQKRESASGTSDVRFVEGCFLLVRTSIFDSVGGMDEGFLFFQEDADLCTRLRKIDRRILSVPSASITHVGGASLGKAEDLQSSSFLSSLVKFHERHGLRRAIWLARKLKLLLILKISMLKVLQVFPLRSAAIGRSLRGSGLALVSIRNLRSQWRAVHHDQIRDPLVSVVIPTCDRPDSLRLLLSDLARQTYSNIEVLVVDQESGALSRDVAAALSGDMRIKIIRSSIRNRSNAKNAGMRYAQGDLVLFCDDDIRVPPDFVQVHVRNHALPGIGGVSCRTLENGLPPVSTTRICRVTWYGEMIAGYQSDVRCYTGTLVGGNMSVRKEVFRRVGYFDPIYRGTSLFEEQDFSERLRHLGLRILFTNETAVTHLPQAGGNAERRRSDPAAYYRIFHHNETVFFLKNRNRFSLPFTICFCALRSIRQTLQHRLPLQKAFSIFGGVFEGFRSYYASLR